MIGRGSCAHKEDVSGTGKNSKLHRARQRNGFKACEMLIDQGLLLSRYIGSFLHDNGKLTDEFYAYPSKAGTGGKSEKRSAIHTFFGVRYTDF